MIKTNIYINYQKINDKWDNFFLIDYSLYKSFARHKNFLTYSIPLILNSNRQIIKLSIFQI